MTINHIDQLTEWWENAEKSVAHVGDTVIHYEVEDGSYMVYTLDAGPVGSWSRLRVLERAPKPKPVWHDAPAVTAKGREDWDHVEAFSRNDDYDPPRWVDNQGITYTAVQLSEVTPLIEAKVTDEMVERAVDGASVWTSAIPNSLARAMLTAALGIETT